MNSPSESTIKKISVDILPILQIVKHAQDNLPGYVSGQLLGLDNNNVLEVTYAYPIPSEPSNNNVGEYGQTLIGSLSEATLIDSNNVGWYCSSYLNSFCTPEFIETQYQHQKSLGNNACVIIIDAFQMSHGHLSVKAIRLCDSFMKAYGYDNEKGVDEKLTKMNSADIYEEIPVIINVNDMSKALLYQIIHESSYDFDSIDEDMASTSFLEKNLEELINSVDTVINDRLQYVGYVSKLMKQKALQTAWINTRKQENKKREEEGVELLPEYDAEDPAFKVVDMSSSTVESLSNYNALRNFCNRINTFADSSLHSILSDTNKNDN
ncbi:hypothetical protein WA158_006475 [Blastocystis sp. Blastoise]